MDEIPVALPGRCTDITTHKNKSDRVLLFVNGDLLNDFSIFVVKEAGLRKGDMITEDICNQLQREDRRYRLKDQMYRWLSVRNHSSGEILVKSRQKGYTSEEIAGVTQEFLEKGLIDDALYACQFAESKAGTKAWGPLKIRMALSQKGIKKQYIDRALEALLPDGAIDDLLVDAAKSARKRLMRVEPGFKRKKKLVNFLVGRGFPGNQVLDKADYVLKQLENEET